MESLSAIIGSEFKSDRIPKALVIGSGLTAMITCSELKSIGFSVFMLETPHAISNDLQCSARGEDMGSLAELLQVTRDQIQIHPSAVWPRINRDESGFAVDTQTMDDERFDVLFYAGTLGSRAPISSFSGLAELFSPGIKLNDSPEDIVYLLDHDEPSDPAAGMAAILGAVKNVDAGGKSFVIFRNAPVRHPYGESLCDTARKSGVMFYRLAEHPVEVDQVQSPQTGVWKLLVKFQDNIEQDVQIEISCDRLLQVTGPDPDSIPTQARSFFGMDVDSAGFMVSDSIHANTCKSFMNGVYCVGSFTGTTDLLSVISQAKASAASAWTHAISNDHAGTKLKLQVSDECVRCLTCFRICPHSAIWPEASTSRSQMKSIGAACLECGICVSECPRSALDIIHFPDIAFTGFLEDIKQTPGKVVVYGCSRSAGRAAAKTDLPDNVAFFSVPCAGRVSESVILDTIKAGVDGLLIIGCHHGNCASNNGSDWACDRVRLVVNDFLTPAGLKKPLDFKTMAPNETAKLSRIVGQFLEKIKAG